MELGVNVRYATLLRSTFKPKDINITFKSNNSVTLHGYNAIVEQIHDSFVLVWWEEKVADRLHHLCSAMR